MTTTESTGSNAIAVLVSRGMADRTETYRDLLTLADSFTGDRQVTTASVVGLVARAVSQLSPCLSDLSVRLLIVLIEHIKDQRAWRTGRLTVWPGNKRLAAFTGRTDRSIRRALAQLEANHWIVRRYTCANRRADGGAGIDLRPVAARLHELRQAEIFLEEHLSAEREQARSERDDLALFEARCAERQEEDQGTIESGEVDGFVHRKSYKLNPGSLNLVHGGASQAAPGREAPVQKAPAEVDRELLFMMVEASPTLQKQLTAAELCDLIGPSPSAASVRATTNAVQWILRHQVKLRPAVWQIGVQRHGWAALAAVVVAVDRQGVRDPAGYLHSMLKAARLRDTVRHNLRALAAQEGGYA